MSAPEAPEPAAVSSALSGWLARMYGGRVSGVGKPERISGGFDFWIYGVEFAGSGLPDAWAGRLVVRMAQRAERFADLEREGQLQTWAASHGFPAPAVIGLLRPEELLGFPAQVVRRVPGITMLDAMTSHPLRVPGLITRLGQLQARLHGLPAPEVAPDSDLAVRRLDLVRRVVEQTSDPALARSLELVEGLLPRLVVPKPALCHGDLHPLNVLVDGDEISLIDWTDAGVGDRHGDIARTNWLFRVAAVGAPSATERAGMRLMGPFLARGHLSGYRAQRPIDESRLLLWYPLHLLHLWAMTRADELGLRGPALAGDFLNRRLGPWARQQLEMALRRAR